MNEKSKNRLLKLKLKIEDIQHKERMESYIADVEISISARLALGYQPIIMPTINWNITA